MALPTPPFAVLSPFDSSEASSALSRGQWHRGRGRDLDSSLSVQWKIHSRNLGVLRGAAAFNVFAPVRGYLACVAKTAQSPSPDEQPPGAALPSAKPRKERIENRFAKPAAQNPPDARPPPPTRRDATYTPRVARTRLGTRPEKFGRACAAARRRLDGLEPLRRRRAPRTPRPRRQALTDSTSCCTTSRTSRYTSR